MKDPRRNTLRMYINKATTLNLVMQEDLIKLIAKDVCNGDVFRYHGLPDEVEKRRQSIVNAVNYAIDLMKENSDLMKGKFR